jgi:hypothetical protein
MSARISGATTGRPGPFRRFFQVQKILLARRAPRRGMTIQALIQEGVTAKIDWVSGKVVPRTFYVPTLRKRGAVMKRVALVVANIVPMFAWGSGQVVAAPPLDVDLELTLDGEPGNLPQLCDFPVLLELTGKSKVIELGGGRTIFTSPKLKVLATNLNEPANQVSLNITGAVHQTVLEDGSVKSVFTGRNLVLGTLDVPTFLDLTIGHFTFVVAADGTTIVQELSGSGQRIKICDVLAGD